MQRINDKFTEKSNIDKLFKRKMLALGNLANIVSAVSSTVGSIKIVIGVIKEVSKQNVNKMENLRRRRTKSSLLLS